MKKIIIERCGDDCDLSNWWVHPSSGRDPILCDEYDRLLGLEKFGLERVAVTVASKNPRKKGFRKIEVGEIAHRVVRISGRKINKSLRGVTMIIDLWDVLGFRYPEPFTIWVKMEQTATD